MSDGSIIGWNRGLERARVRYVSTQQPPRILLRPRVAPATELLRHHRKGYDDTSQANQAYPAEMLTKQSCGDSSIIAYYLDER